MPTLCGPVHLVSGWTRRGKAAIHADLPGWIEVAMSQLDRHCTRVGPDDSEWDSGDDPTPATAARFICTKPSQMVTEALTHANGYWAGQVYTVVIAPLRQQISEKQDRQKALKAELKAPSVEGKSFRSVRRRAMRRGGTE